ncbi:MAG: hypothetical protein KDH15_09510 [Rhodocyclaceae bacterium]|nr:hypothetical protein [Rhodocyclaceae bacterium]
MPYVQLSRFADPVITALTVLKANLRPTGWDYQDPMVQRAFQTLRRRGFPNPDSQVLASLGREDFDQLGKISEILDDRFRMADGHPGIANFSANLSRAIVSHALQGAQLLKELFGVRDVATGALVESDLRVPGQADLLQERQDALLRGPTSQLNAHQPGISQGNLANMSPGSHVVLGHVGNEAVVVRCDAAGRYSLYREANGQWMRLAGDLSAPQMVAVQQMSEMNMAELGQLPPATPSYTPTDPTRGAVYDILPVAPGAEPENIYESADAPLDPQTKQRDTMTEMIFDAFCVM